MDYHFVYKDVEGTSTEWDDIQRRLGNAPAMPESFKPPPFAPSEDPDLCLKSKDWIDEHTVEELKDLEDDPDIDDNRFLEEYRCKFLFLLLGLHIFVNFLFDFLKSIEYHYKEAEVGGDAGGG